MAQKDGALTRKKYRVYRTILILLILAATYIVMWRTGVLDYFNPQKPVDPDEEIGMDYWFMFVFGLMVSVHCVALCGGINLSQCVPKHSDKSRRRRFTDKFSGIYPSFFYNVGRVASYTIAGVVMGAVGYMIVPSELTTAILKLIVGVLMLAIGINMLGIFPLLRKIKLKVPRIFANKIDTSASQGKTPFVIGMLTWFMPCGPHQVVHLYALSTCDPVMGGLGMMFFALGTLPLMFAYGTFGSLAGKTVSRRMVTIGAMLVTILGIFMLSQGMRYFRWAQTLSKTISTSASMLIPKPKQAYIQAAGGESVEDIESEDENEDESEAISDDETDSDE